MSQLAVWIHVTGSGSVAQLIPDAAAGEREFRVRAGTGRNPDVQVLVQTLHILTHLWQEPNKTL